MGSKHKTFRGIPVDLYRKMREELNNAEFESWVFRATGKARMRNNVTGKEKAAGTNWEALSKKLQKALTAQIEENKALESHVAMLQISLHKLENKSWISRLLSLKG